MALYDRIPLPYLRWLPALYFAAIGTYDIGIDAWHHRLTTWHVLVNLVFFVPLLVPHRLVYYVFGGLFSLGAAYTFWALLTLLIQHNTDGDGLYILALACATLLSSTALILAGQRLSKNRPIKQGAFVP